MTDTNDIQVARLQLTKEILDDLGITEGINKKFPNQPAMAKGALDEYSKYFSQIWKVLYEPTKVKE